MESRDLLQSNPDLVPGGARRLLATTLLLLSAACSSLPPTRTVHISDDTPGISYAPYQRALKAWTRYASHYEGLNQRFFLAATWESWPFRQQRILATAQFLGQTEEEVAGALGREREEARQWVDLFVGFYTADNSWNDLSSPTSIWRVELQYPDGTVVFPSSVERVGRPDANLKALYPYLTSFWLGYRFRFPSSVEGGALDVTQGGDIVFRIASAVGRAESRWAVSPWTVPDDGA